MINYFNYKKLNNEFLLTNDFGKYAFLDSASFKEFLQDQSVSSLPVRQDLLEKGFLFDSSKEAFINDFRYTLMKAKNYLYTSTSLHIFVVTTACNQQCRYCQAQNGLTIPTGFMTTETAKKAVDIAMQSPTKNLSFEFQGGEPLLNFEVIRFIVEYSDKTKKDKNIEYSLVSNLTLLTDEIVEFIKEYKISISTSVDGPEDLHNTNRPFRDGQKTYQKVEEEIKKLQKAGITVGAIQTTTRDSLKCAKEIVDSYLELNLRNLSLRALSPLGCARKDWQKLGYDPDEFLSFYREAFHYIVDLNLQGIHMEEGIAKIFLNKILLGKAINYMELRSPCGAALGQMAYYCDGAVYTCDEGRMIAEMGNKSFLLGTVDDDYNTLMDSRICRGTCTASILEAIPSCSDCVYQPYCGVCPAVMYSLYGDLYEKSPKGYRCKIYGGILDIIFETLQESNQEKIEVFRSWLE